VVWDIYLTPNPEIEGWNGSFSLTTDRHIRTTKDPRTLGSLFYAGCDELRQVSFAEAFTMLLSLFQQALRGIPASIAGRIQALLDSFVAAIPAMMQRMLLIPAWKY